MGYYTNFQLTVFEGTADMDAVRIALGHVMGLPSEESPFENDGDCITTADSLKWYDHDDDCAEMSTQFPNVVFKLHGEGEETGDLWDAYYKDGKCQICRAKAVYPPYDPTKMTSVLDALKNDRGRNDY
jgi:hypothetical protein